MKNPRGNSGEHTSTQQAPVDGVDREPRTFADVEGGEPDPTLDEMPLDSAII